MKISEITPTKTKKLVLFGTEDLALIAHEYFTNDSEYEVVAFTVDKKYIREENLMGLPVIAFEDIDFLFPPSTHEVHVCVVYGNMNRTRAAICQKTKDKGYKLASYISSHSFVSSSAKIGEHAFIFEDNTIQPFVTIGDNIILWSGNHCGHHSNIGNNVFISSHVVISGWCNIGDNCFLGVNSTLANNTTLGSESWVCHGAIMGGHYTAEFFCQERGKSDCPSERGSPK